MAKPRLIARIFVAIAASPHQTLQTLDQLGRLRPHYLIRIRHDDNLFSLRSQIGGARNNQSLSNFYFWKVVPSGMPPFFGHYV